MSAWLGAGAAQLDGNAHRWQNYFLSVIDIWITNCQSINFLEPYIHQEINTDPVDLDKFRFVQPLDIANVCHDRHNQRLCTFFEPSLRTFWCT